MKCTPRSIGHDIPLANAQQHAAGVAVEGSEASGMTVRLN